QAERIDALAKHLALAVRRPCHGLGGNPAALTAGFHLAPAGILLTAEHIESLAPGDDSDTRIVLRGTAEKQHRIACQRDVVPGGRIGGIAGADERRQRKNRSSQNAGEHDISPATRKNPESSTCLML